MCVANALMTWSEASGQRDKVGVYIWPQYVYIHCVRRGVWLNFRRGCRRPEIQLTHGHPCKPLVICQQITNVIYG